MGIEITMSSKGQIVIPKDVRDALGLKPGGRLSLERLGNRIVLQAPQPPRERISYEEFRRRVPKYEGPPVAVEDMTVDFAGLVRWREQNGG
ncbi:AbrB/MazE/SpoVT family DNA-binding domain-containing protein [Sphingomonas rubra]|uniref:Looped-hinge helix DNA binding domain-containing protein, AbrB family n=1 Tax=Sphingomonas rubra TaxID=634430 RepID=A0A1I5UCP3_9SPHN|nr:AbrB/MazE/SpoVT family DNA-binding domain-containing protein [Sphingomonas rubra]SFP92948.1 looped-hinge helix DNA binding domain-containing protein, AbrB family [Sphingomonas rubra]